MKHTHKLWVRIIATAVIGLLLAGAGSVKHDTRPCSSADVPAGEPTAHCVSIGKTLNPTHFAEIFVITSFASFAILSIINVAQKGKLRPASQLKG
ncbi:MAG: hypothetical protein ABI602_01185 [Candidatus Saccharibacteria bacterium]